MKSTDFFISALLFRMFRHNYTGMQEFLSPSSNCPNPFRFFSISNWLLPSDQRFHGPRPPLIRRIKDSCHSGRRPRTTDPAPMLSPISLKHIRNEWQLFAFLTFVFLLNGIIFFARSWEFRQFHHLDGTTPNEYYMISRACGKKHQTEYFRPAKS